MAERRRETGSKHGCAVCGAAIASQANNERRFDAYSTQSCSYSEDEARLGRASQRAAGLQCGTDIDHVLPTVTS